MNTVRWARITFERQESDIYAAYANCCGDLDAQRPAVRAGGSDIFRWDNGQLIPGTAGITPAPGVQLARMDLQYAELSGIDLTNADFEDSDLTRVLTSITPR